MYNFLKNVGRVPEIFFSFNVKNIVFNDCFEGDAIKNPQR